MGFEVDKEDDEPDGSTIEELMFLLERQRDLLVAVATGTSIDPKNDGDYKKRRRKLRRGFERFGVSDPYPWPDLYRGGGIAQHRGSPSTKSDGTIWPK
jgi:hypothetical protein